MVEVSRRGDRRNLGSLPSKIDCQTPDLGKSLKSSKAMSPIVRSAALRKHGAWQNCCVPRWKMFMASAQKRETRRSRRLCLSDGVKSRDEAETDEAETNSTKQFCLGRCEASRDPVAPRRNERTKMSNP